MSLREQRARDLFEPTTGSESAPDGVTTTAERLMSAK